VTYYMANFTVCQEYKHVSNTCCRVQKWCMITEVGKNVYFVYSTICIDYENKNMVVVQKFSLPFGLMVITKSEFKKNNSFVHQVYRKLRQPWCCVIMDVSIYK